MAYHLKKQAKREADAEREKENRAALTIQLAWRRKKGSMVSKFCSPKPKKGIPPNTSLIYTALLRNRSCI